MLQKYKPQDAEEGHVVKLLADAFETAIDDWCKLSPSEQKINDIIDLQINGVFEVLFKLGLDLTTLAKLNTQDSMIFPVGHVQHYKGGHYLVLGGGIHTETEESLTIYCKEDKTSWYVRPIKMFHEFLHGTKRPRFNKRIVARLIEIPIPVHTKDPSLSVFDAEILELFGPGGRKS